jgi:hypothetical protein
MMKALDKELRFEDLRVCLDKAYYEPFRVYQWQSNRGYTKWTDVEGFVDWLAGPLFNICDGGDCGYVYRDNDRFPLVKDEEGLKLLFQRQLQEIETRIHAFRPVNTGEKIDFEYMLECIEELRAACILALLIVAEASTGDEQSDAR